MKHSPEKIGKNIKTERLKRSWSQAKLGNYLGVSGKQISNYENEDTNKCTLPPLDILLKMCDLFECDLGYLIGEDGYSQKTKKLTIASSETGFTEESLKNIREVMGIESKNPFMKYEAEEYQKVINNFVSSPKFIKLIIELKQLDDIYSRRCSFEKKCDSESEEINSKLAKMAPKKAAFIKEKFNDPIDFDEALTPEELLIRNSLSDDEKSIIRRLNSLIDEERDNLLTFERDMKYQRYVIQETMSFLLNNLYPIDTD